MSEDISGKVIVITGASSGIGRAAARLLADKGARLALVARESPRLTALTESLGDAAIAVPADLSQPADTDAMIARTLAHYGRIDVLFANAGVYIPGNVAEGDPDDWERMMAINVTSVFRAAQRVLPGMIAQGSGDIIVTSSISGHQALHWEPIYSASKHAIRSFVHGLRRQALPHGIRVGSISPGVVLNELWGIDDPAEITRRVADRTGLMSEDIADALLYSLTRSRHVTIRDMVILPAGQDI
ncbi:SDR family oxidoreductase [Acidisoma cellulosilytica]|uniref:SDR family oxidoreductase n=1 Tax=Acidisoma cellulosilyticum TaxID=2802395 RepID=A0A963YZ58_9PROT|nr:SDR family oxidoreductase [Acidisoma cellulosilyticum]MCB8879771.1 SDR family oxidoreductase [Acidisoma cellulosilyticum]